MYDVIIVGGGIGGLYTAWRLATSTTLTVLVLEAEKEFGGRYLTCEMPGGHMAGFGAMRFLPSRHKILYKLIKDLNLEIETFWGEEENSEKKLIGFFKNTPIYCENDYKRVYSLTENDLPYLNPEDYDFQIKAPENGNLFEGTVGETGQKAKDMSLRQYYSYAPNTDILGRGFMLHTMEISVAAAAMFAKKDEDFDPLEQDYCVKDGMIGLTKKLVSNLNKMDNVTLLAGEAAVEVTESGDVFKVATASSAEPFTGQKLILACNRSGIESIVWNCPSRRNMEFRELFSNTISLKSTKVFLTYTDAWWEDAGLVSGRFGTDLPISCVAARGGQGKMGGYATLLSAYTFTCSDVFEGLNQSRYERFKPSAGNVPSEYLPSQKLVDFVQQQLCTVFGLKSIPAPVGASIKIWDSKRVSGGSLSQIGVDSYQLQFKTLKPFPEAEIYIAGDVFFASTKDGAFYGWSEGSLITSERILVSHFGLSPFCTEVNLNNEFP